MKDIHDIKSPIEIFYNYIPILITAMVLLTLLLWFIYLSLRKKTVIDKKEEVINKNLDPKSFALSELEKIRKEKLIELNRYHAFYNRLTNIMKSYLIQKYRIDTESKTTTEIIETIKSLNLNNDLYNHFELCLKNYDYAKYSGYKVDDREMNESFDLTKGLFKSVN